MNRLLTVGCSHSSIHCHSSSSLRHIWCFSMCSYDYQTLDFDIMLIKLFHPVKFTDTVQPIPLPSGCPYGGMECSVSGWGDTRLGGEGVLMKVITQPGWHKFNACVYVWGCILNCCHGKVFCLWKSSNSTTTPSTQSCIIIVQQWLVFNLSVNDELVKGFH